MLFNLIYKISKWYLRRPIINKKNFAREWLTNSAKSDIKIITSPNAWKYFENSCEIKKSNIILNPPLEVEELNKITNEIESNFIVGIGSGRIMDISKYIAYRMHKKGKNPKLILIPSITSTTSWMNMAIAIRKDNELFMPGNIHANKIIFDPEYISSAPLNLNVGGLIDLLASISAMNDWKLSNTEKNEKISKKSLMRFDEFANIIYSKSEDLKNSSYETIEFIFNSFLDALALCGASLSGRPLEGSEHFLYYAIDENDERMWNHGQIIALCMLITLRLQEKIIPNTNNLKSEKLLKFLKEVDINFKPSDLNIKNELLIEVINEMKFFVENKGYYYTIWNKTDNLNQRDIESIINWIEQT